MDAPIAIFEDDSPIAGKKLKQIQSQPSEAGASPPKEKEGSGNSNTSKFSVGTIVTVEDRTWPGRNDPGGVARIIKINHPASTATNWNERKNTSVTYDVKYIVETRKERNVEEKYISLHSEYTSPEKEVNARNGFATKRPSPPLSTTTIRATGRSKSPMKRSSAREKNVSKKVVELKSTSSPQQAIPLARGNSIQSYFSNKDESSPIQGVKTRDSPSAKAAVAKSPTKKKSSPTRPNSIVCAHALGLVRVEHPNPIACSMAVARAKDQPFDPNAKRNSSTEPKRIFPGALLGRTSNSKKRPNFVDLGIPAAAAGISRNHVKILKVSGLLPVNTSAAAASNTSNQGESPSMLLSVDEKANRLQVFRTRRGGRTGIFLYKGQQKTLRIGDAIVFHSNDNLSYCVVGLMFPMAANANGSEEGVGGLSAGAAGGEWNGTGTGGGRDAARILEFTPPVGRKKAPPLERGTYDQSGDKKKQDEKNVEDTVSGTKKNMTMDTIEIVDDDDDKMEVEMKSQETMTQPLSQQPLLAEDADQDEQKPLSVDVASLQETSATTATKSAVAASAAATKPDESMMDVTMELEDSLTATVAHDDQECNNAAAASSEVVLQESKKCESSLSETATAVISQESSVAIVQKKEPPCLGETLIKKGDNVKVLYDKEDMFGDIQNEWYFGTVVDVKPPQLPNVNSGASSCSIRVHYDDGASGTYSYPCNDIEKITNSKESFYPETFCVGDIVDAQFQNEKGRSDRGRIACLNENGNACDILYYDNDYETNIPTKEKKIRLIQRGDSSGQWLEGKSAWLCRKTSDGSSHFQTGQVSKQPSSGSSSNYQVTFTDGSTESVGYEAVAKAVLANLGKIVPQSKQYLWPVSSTASMADTIRLRRQRTEQNKSMEADVKAEPKETVKRSGRTRSSTRSSASNNAVAVKAELVDEQPVFDTIDEIDDTWLHEKDDSVDDLYLPVQGGPAIDQSILEKRKVAKDFPPGLPARSSQHDMVRSQLTRGTNGVKLPPGSFVRTRLSPALDHGPEILGFDEVWSKGRGIKRLLQGSA